MAEETESIRAVIVLLGKFNPAIFSPAWFARHGLITDDELDIADLGVVHPEITQFSVEHLQIEVRSDRFIIQMTSDPIVRILDISLSIFGALLPHTPIYAVGINYSESFKLDRWQRRMALGRALAPIGPWGEWGTRLVATDPGNVGGLIKLRMQEKIKGSYESFREVEIAPSNEVKDKTTGVFMLVNEHRGIPEVDADKADAAVLLLERHFEMSVISSKKIIHDMLDFAKSLPI